MAADSTQQPSALQVTAQHDTVAASLLLEQGYPAAACKLLHSTTTADNKDAGRWYLLARCAADLQQYKQAIAYYRKTIDLLPQAPKPRAELATLYLTQGRAQEAGQLFAEAGRLSASSEVSRLMDSLVEQLSANDPAALVQVRSAKPWSIEVYAGLTHDDNVNGGPVSNVVPAIIGGTPITFTLAPGAMPRSSTGAAASVSGSYVLPLSQKWSLLWQAALAGTAYTSESDFNNNNFSLAAAFIYRTRGFSASVQPSLRYARQNKMLQEATPGVVARISQALSPAWTAIASLGYFDRTVKLDENRNATAWQGSIGAITQVSRNLQIGAEYELQREKADLNIHTRDLHGPSLFATYKATPDLTLVANYRYSSIRYDQPPSFMFDKPRSDRQQIAAMTALWDISSYAGRNMVVRAQYMYIDNPSNIAYNEYTRNVVSVGVQTQF